MTQSNELTLGEVEARNVEHATGLMIATNPAQRTPMQAKLAQTWGGGEHGEWDGTCCKLCRGSIPALTHRFEVSDEIAHEVPVTICDDCASLVREHYNGRPALQVNLNPRFDEDCPTRLRELILSREFPPNFNRTAYERVTKWTQSSDRGLVLVGESGTGKTTALWALFRIIERTGGNPKFLSGVELGRTLSTAARDLERIDWLKKTRVLIIDDLGKERLTPAVAGLLWELLDHRHGFRLPTLISLKYSGEAFRERFGDKSIGNDIARRIHEMCEFVPFSARQSAAA